MILIRKKIHFSIFLFFLCLTAIYPEKIQFKYNPGTKVKIEAEIKGKYYENRQPISTYTQKYKTIEIIKSVKDGIGTIDMDKYYFKVDDLAITGLYPVEITRQEKSTYSRDAQGTIFIEADKIFPTYRNVPYLPDRDLKKGDSWKAVGTEVQNFFNDEVISRIPIEVVYTFKGYDESTSDKVAIIEYSFSHSITNNENYDIDRRILRIVGTSKTTMFFDVQRGIRVKELYERNYGMEVYNGVTKFQVHFVDSGERRWYVIEEMKKDEIQEDLKKEIEKSKVDDVTVEKDEKGVKISLENIQFQPDSFFLQDQEKRRLQKIGKILEKYKDKQIMVVGHTTNRGTPEGRNKLSIMRARSVAEYLNQIGAIDPGNTTYIGKGGTEPIADNSTQEGLKRNRRVEIYILEE